MSKLPPLDCLRAVVVILNSATHVAPEVIAEKLDSAADLVEEVMVELEASGGK